MTLEAPRAYNYAASALGGLAIFVSLPPRGWWAFGVVGWGLIAVALADQPTRRRVGIATIGGLFWFVPALSWIAEVSVVGWLLLACAEALIVAGVVAGGVSGPARVVALPAAAVIAEAIRWRWPLGGLPMGSVVLGQLDGPFAPVARLGGPLLVVGLAAVSGAVLAEVARRRSRSTVVTGIVAAGLFSGLIAWGVHAPAGYGVGSLRVAAVQGGGPRGTHALNTATRVVFQRHQDASLHVPDGVDVVVWPEDVIEDTAPITTSPEARALAHLAARLHATVFAGVVEDLDAHRFANAVIGWAPNGQIIGRVDKVHRVPFGEYIPARAFLSHLVDLSRVPRDAVAGHRNEMLDIGGTRVGFAISYEVFFPARARDVGSHGAELLLVPTNASSYRSSAPAAEELAAARLRAIETGRALVQAAPTGFSAIINADGDVVQHSQLSQQAVLVATVSLRRGTTIYTHVGDTPVLALCIALLIASQWRHRRSAPVPPAAIRATPRRSEPRRAP